MQDVTIEFPVGDDPPKARLIYGVDVREGLKLLEDGSVNTVCTSPPYWGLRDYGVDNQIGLEDDIHEYVANIVAVFDECKRVLRKDGTLWVKLGDSYAGGGGSSGHNANTTNMGRPTSSYGSVATGGRTPNGLKAKDLVGIPWRVALALQDAGWYLRSDIIWAKGSCMPESVRDRPTKSHEYVFLFAHPESKGKYYYDIEAIKEPSVTSDTVVRGSKGVLGSMNKGLREDSVEDHSGTMRNKRSVWNVNPKGFKGAHFACWPPALVEPMIKAGCPRFGTVLDPFSGSATTGQVALGLGRDYIGIDLNEDYLRIAESRLLGRKHSPKVFEDGGLLGMLKD